MKTTKLIKKLKLKPTANESQYSQSFIERERDMVKRINKASEYRINEQSDKQMTAKKKFESYKDAVINRKLGLKPKPNIEQ
jgi:hypothetical protein